MNYGSFIYGSESESKLSIPDPVHHICIRLATGAFYTSFPAAEFPSLQLRDEVNTASTPVFWRGLLRHQPQQVRVEYQDPST
jgi:hypothetical protein